MQQDKNTQVGVQDQREAELEQYTLELLHEAEAAQKARKAAYQAGETDCPPWGSLPSYRVETLVGGQWKLDRVGMTGLLLEDHPGIAKRAEDILSEQADLDDDEFRMYLWRLQEADAA